MTRHRYIGIAAIGLVVASSGMWQSIDKATIAVATKVAVSAGHLTADGTGPMTESGNDSWRGFRPGAKYGRVSD